jgi:hypothetical protein
VFAKLGITSRAALRDSLQALAIAATAAHDAHTRRRLAARSTIAAFPGSTSDWSARSKAA